MVFSVLAKRNREAYLTREVYIWPYQGAAIPAIDRMMDEFERAVEQIETARASLKT
jgi:hypothetical protein